ncbi:glycosyltransferase family 2 protein [Pseudomonas sp. J452]|uniref:glycosyltransferase family 2 protein n=1 Tax=Pseudomonas sp. J452 TaxID=2898441 RepID=UPI0021AD9ED4|nr:glycosyltransferase family 2 protein [Pseudomonas sp. J452]UUY09351.1 glycosyltransferase family 2 protein [Pseudomonas sp. J452]
MLLSTHNGARFLREQLDSIIAQTHANWLIVASDDGSTDATLTILEDYRNKLGAQRLQIRRGPCRGYAANFLSTATDKSIEADAFAFADQDDVWHPDKLERAVSWLCEQPQEQPSLYCSRTRLIDASGDPIGCSPLFSKPPSFRNALVQSLAGGNTMVFNRAARNLLAEAGTPPIVSHDWWFYMLITGYGGLLHYDPSPSIDYRQHGANIIGSNLSLSDHLYRLRRLLSGHFQRWNEINLRALSLHENLLTEENQKVLIHFAQARQTSWLDSLRTLLSCGIYRQTTLGNLGLAAAALLRRI